jgi:hypothetical protein
MTGTRCVLTFLSDLQVLKIPVEMLDPEEFSNEDEVRDKLREFIEFRCVEYLVYERWI